MKIKMKKDIYWAIAGILLSILYLFSLMGFDENRIVGDLGDAFFNNFVLEHGYAWLSGQVDSFWNGLFFYPERLVLAFSDNHLGTLAFYAASRFLGFSPEASFQHWMFWICILNFLSTFIFFRKLKIACSAAFILSLVFAFSMPMIQQLGHIQLLPRFLIPPLFYLLHRFVETNNIQYLGLASLCFVFQMYCGIYIGFFSVFVVGFMFLCLLLLSNESYRSWFLRPKKDYLILLLYFVPAIVLSLVLFYPYIIVSFEKGNRSWSNVLTMIPHVETWFYTTSSFMYSWLGHIGAHLPMQHEHKSFMGLLPLLMLPFFAYFSFVRKSLIYDKNLQMACFISALAGFVFYTQFNGYTLYYFLYHIPGFSAIRAVSRIAIVLIFPLLILLGIFLTHLLKQASSQRQKTAYTLLCIFILAEQFFLPGSLHTYNRNESKQIRKHVASLVPTGSDAFFYYTFNNRPFYTNHIAAMFASLETGIPTFNGYSGLIPDNYGNMLKMESPNSIHRYLRLLKNKESLKNKRINIISEYDEISEEIDTKSLNEKEYSPQKKPLSDFDYELRFPSAPKVYKEGSALLKVVFINQSKEIFHANYQGKYGLALSYRITPNQKWNNRVFLPKDVHPGEKVTFYLKIKGITVGVNTIEFSMVQELVCWFHDKGQKIYQINIIRER